MSRTTATTISHARRVRSVVLCALTALAACASTAASAQAQTAGARTDFSPVASNTADGNLLGSTLKLTGVQVDGIVTNDTSTLFAAAAFSPALPWSDEIQIAGPPKSGSPGSYPFKYTITPGAEVKNPVIHLGSLGSRVAFPDGTLVTKRSGNVVVEGSSVRGTPVNSTPSNPLGDSSGSVQLWKTYDKDHPITFEITPVAAYTASVRDGIYIQLVVPVQCADWRSATATGASGDLPGAGVTLSPAPGSAGRLSSPLDGAVINGISTYFGVPAFSPSLVQSDTMQFFGGASGHTYALRFSGQGVKDPILQLGSLASTITFTTPIGTGAFRVRGEDDFKTPTAVSVSGSASNRRPDGLTDANGTIKLAGTYTEVGFRADYNGPSPDGVYLQVCAAV